jgi:hypothetical protein
MPLTPAISTSLHNVSHDVRHDVGFEPSRDTLDRRDVELDRILLLIIDPDSLLLLTLVMVLSYSLNENIWPLVELDTLASRWYVQKVERNGVARSRVGEGSKRVSESHLTALVLSMQR